VVGKVEGSVVDPQRQPLGQRGAQHDLAQPRNLVQATPELLAHRVQPHAPIAVMQRSGLGDGQDRDMLGQSGAFEVEKTSVLDTQAVIAAGELAHGRLPADHPRTQLPMEGDGTRSRRRQRR
jgi:hypothetical protein